MRRSSVFLIPLFWAVLATQSEAELEYHSIKTDEGTSVLIVAGEFEANDDVGNFLAEVQRIHPDLITFDSMGGSVVTAMKLGRLIRSQNLSTVQLRNLDCVSACALAFLGGSQRFAQAGAIGVHKSFLAPDADLDRDAAVSMIQSLTAETISYLVEMGVDPELLKVALSYESSDMRYLSTSEMIKFRVVTDTVSSDNQSGTGTNSTPHPSDTYVAAPTQPSRPRYEPNGLSALLDIPVPRTGTVRYPRGSIDLKAGPDAKSATVARLNNHTRVEIVASDGRWYQVRAGNLAGYAHHTWIKVDQFAPTFFDQKFVQIKSFDNFQDAAQYVRALSIPTRAYLASNGWFAIVLQGTFSDEDASRLLVTYKHQGLIPEDSYKTYGNTYVRDVCCN